MDNIKLGVQLYTLRKYLKKTSAFDAILGYVKGLGVNDVQISGIGNISAEKQKELLDKHGISTCVTHVSFARLRNDLDNVIREHKIINCDCIGLGSMPREYTESLEKLREFIGIMKPICDKIKENGMVFAYHNHTEEYKKIDGERTIMDILLTETSPESFWFIPDVCWFDVAGKDPVAELNRMKGRVKVVHFKDYVKRLGNVNFVSLGKGVVNLDACYKACQSLGINYIMYEQDRNWSYFSPKYATKISCQKLFELKNSNN